MALFNYASKELTLKVVYYGPGLSGKTTNLQYLHTSLDPDKKGRLLSLATESDRTLFFDFLPVDLGKIRDFRVKFQLYTVPGQIRYNATRRLVLKGADAVVFVADSQREMRDSNIESFENMRENLEANNIDPDGIPVVLQYNKRDLPDLLSPEELDVDLNPCGYQRFEAVAVNGTGVEDTFKAATKILIKDFAEKYNVQFEKARSPEFQTGVKKPLRAEAQPAELPEHSREETSELFDTLSQKAPGEDGIAKAAPGDSGIPWRPEEEEPLAAVPEEPELMTVTTDLWMETMPKPEPERKKSDAALEQRPGKKPEKERARQKEKEIAAESAPKPARKEAAPEPVQPPAPEPVLTPLPVKIETAPAPAARAGVNAEELSISVSALREEMKAALAGLRATLEEKGEKAPQTDESEGIKTIKTALSELSSGLNDLRMLQAESALREDPLKEVLGLLKETKRQQAEILSALDGIRKEIAESLKKKRRGLFG